MNDTRHTEMKAMDARTLEALRGSIAKWEGIVAGITRNENAENCPLCRLFNPVVDGNDALWSAPCRGCPVMGKTGKKFCQGTPYERYEFMEEEIDEGENPDVSEASLKPIALEELDFLKSLLPVETQSDEEQSRG